MDGQTGRITSFDVKTLRRVRDRIQELLDQHGFEGVQIGARRITYTEGDAHITVVVRIDGAESREYRALQKAAAALDLDLERVVNGKRLVGFESRRRRYPFTVLDLKDARFKMTVQAAVRCFGRKPAEAEEVVRDTMIDPAPEADPGPLLTAP